METLKTNRRSETSIIRFNNQFFTAAVEFLNTLHLNELNEESVTLETGLCRVAQESPKSEVHGYVKASFLRRTRTRLYGTDASRHGGEEVKRLMKRRAAE